MREENYWLDLINHKREKALFVNRKEEAKTEKHHFILCIAVRIK